MVSDGIKSRLNNCRTFLISSNSDARNAFDKLFETNDLKGLETFIALEHVQKKLEEYASSNMGVQLIVLDIDGELYKERLQFFKFLRRFLLTVGTPIIILNKDWNNKQKKSLDDSECHDGYETSDEDIWFSDKLAKFVNRPLDMNWVVDHIENLVDEAYPDGISNFKVNKKDKKCEITMPSIMDKVNFCELELIINNIDGDGIKDLVFNFSLIESITSQNLRLIFQMSFKLKKLGIRCYSIHVKDQVKTMMDQSGMLESFNVRTVAKKVVSNTVQKQTSVSNGNGKYTSINVNMVKPFILSSINCFNNFIDISMQPQQPRMMDNYSCSASSSFATVIKLESPIFVGSILQIYSKETFIKLCKQVAVRCKTHDVKVIMTKMYKLLDEIFLGAQKRLATSGIELFEDEKEIKLVHSYDSIMKEISDTTSIIIPIESKLGYVSMVINGQSA